MSYNISQRGLLRWSSVLTPIMVVVIALLFAPAGVWAGPPGGDVKFDFSRAAAPFGTGGWAQGIDSYNHGFTITLPDRGRFDSPGAFSPRVNYGEAFRLGPDSGYGLLGGAVLPYDRGYNYTSDIGASRLAQGYLGLILDTPLRRGDRDDLPGRLGEEREHVGRWGDYGTVYPRQTFRQWWGQADFGARRFDGGDEGGFRRSDADRAPADSYTAAVNSYLNWRLNEKLRLGNRSEWAGTPARGSAWVLPRTSFVPRVGTRGIVVLHPAAGLRLTNVRSQPYAPAVAPGYVPPFETVYRGLIYRYDGYWTWRPVGTPIAQGKPVDHGVPDPVLQAFGTRDLALEKARTTPTKTRGYTYEDYLRTRNGH